MRWRSELGLHLARTLGKQTMRAFDALCLPPVRALSARQIRAIRSRDA